MFWQILSRVLTHFRQTCAQYDGDDILPVTVGNFPAGGHVLLIETRKDLRGRRYAHVQETFDFHDRAVYDHQGAEIGDGTHLDGWVQLTDHNAVLSPVLLPESETAKTVGMEQLSALLGAELQLATLLAWARQPAPTAIMRFRGVSPPRLMSTAMYDAAAGATGSATAGGAGATERGLPSTTANPSPAALRVDIEPAGPWQDDGPTPSSAPKAAARGRGGGAAGGGGDQRAFSGEC